jgi:tRNA synthetases class I (R)
MPRNVLDEIDEILGQRGLVDDIGVVIPHHPGRSEFGLVGSPGAWTDARSPVASLEALPSIGAVRKGRMGKMDLVLADDWVAERGAMLEAGSPGPMETGDLAAGAPFVIDFCDPNATKALHIGHLRNLAIGAAITGLTRFCGASVTTQSQVGDMGRSMGEAMAGYTLFGAGAEPGEGRKGDHLVGRCYSRYVAEVAATGEQDAGLASDPALSREDLDTSDLATELMEGWNQGNPEVRALWQRVRSWALDGQRETLERLGIRFDRSLYESDFVAELESIGDQLLRAGIAETAPSGALLYRTDDESYPLLVLRRPDGQSTQHLRYIVDWFATRELMGPATSLEIMGDEWIPHARYGDALMRLLDPGGAIHPSQCVLHGMVEAEDGLVKSSLNEPLLIDALLDDLAFDSQIAERSADREHADQLATTTALGYFLTHSTEKRVRLARDMLLETRSNPGWVLAQAALTAWNPAYDGAPDPQPEDRLYRFLMAQSQVHRQLARRSLGALDTIDLARFHVNLSRWFLRAEPSPSLARAMRTVLAVGMPSLGLPVPHPAAAGWLQVSAPPVPAAIKRSTGLEPASAA